MIVNDNNCDYNCETCDACIYDEDYGKLLIKSEKEIKHFCNKCIYGHATNIESKGKIFSSWFCEHDKPYQAVAINVNADEDVETPAWCEVVQNLTEQCKKNNQMEETYWTKKEKLMALPSLIKWDDIKEGDIYHVPPVLDEKRKDILIKGVHSTWIDYVEIKQDGKKSYNQETYYKSSLSVHFLVPSKIRKVNVVE